MLFFHLVSSIFGNVKEAPLPLPFSYPMPGGNNLKTNLNTLELSKIWKIKKGTHKDTEKSGERLVLLSEIGPGYLSWKKHTKTRYYLSMFFFEEHLASGRAKLNAIPLKILVWYKKTLISFELRGRLEQWIWWWTTDFMEKFVTAKISNKSGLSTEWNFPTVEEPQLTMAILFNFPLYWNFPLNRCTTVL